MPDLGFDYNAADHEPSGFDVLPPEKYPAQITQSDVVDTKAGDGRLLKLTWEIIAPHAMENRKVFQQINLKNKNAQAEKIGLGELRRICDALSIPGIRDSGELEYKPAIITLGIEKDKSGQYPDKNKVTKVEPYTNGPAAPTLPRVASPPLQPAAQQQPAPAPTTGARPWR